LPSTRAIPDRNVFDVARPARSIQYFSFSLFARGEKGETKEVACAVCVFLGAW